MQRRSSQRASLSVICRGFRHQLLLVLKHVSGRITQLKRVDWLWHERPQLAWHPSLHFAESMMMPANSQRYLRDICRTKVVLAAILDRKLPLHVQLSGRVSWTTTPFHLLIASWRTWVNKLGILKKQILFPEACLASPTLVFYASPQLVSHHVGVSISLNRPFTYNWSSLPTKPISPNPPPAARYAPAHGYLRDVDRLALLTAGMRPLCNLILDLRSGEGRGGLGSRNGCTLLALLFGS